MGSHHSSSLRLMRHLVPYWEVFVLGLAGMAATALLTPLIAVLTVPLLDEILVARNGEAAHWVLLAFVGLFVVRGATLYGGVWALQWACGKAALDLQVRLFDRLLARPASLRAPQLDGDAAARLVSGTVRYFQALVDLAVAMGRDALAAAGLLVWMFYLDWRLAALALALVCAKLLAARRVGERLHRAGARARQAQDELGRIFREAMENHKAILLYGGKEHEARRMAAAAARARILGMKQAGVGAIGLPLRRLAVAIALAATMYAAVWWIPAHGVTAGEIASIVVAALMLGASLQRIGAAGESWRQGRTVDDGMFSLLGPGARPDAEAEAGAVIIGHARGELRFESVGFPGEGPEADREAGGIHDVTLTIRPGEIVALVGMSVADQNVLMSMVPRFIVPATGRIRLDGHDLADIAPHSLHANIALVSEDMTLFNDTVAANIAYGAMGLETEARITAAAHAARVSEFVREMPQGLQTVVGGPGLALSGGQRLRIAIARALLKDAPVVIVSEAARADLEAGFAELAALDVLMRGRTVLIGARRLSTAERADRIVVLQQGRIAAVGTHRELMARGGLYARLVRTLV